MTAESEDNTQSPQAQGLEAIGKRLASARLEQQREVSAVATGLHLRTEIVEALEAGDESALPAMTFVRGYIKTYARLVGLDEQDVLSALPSNDSYRVQPLKGVGMRRKQTLRLPLGKGFAWILAMGMVLLLVLYGVPLVERLMDKLDQPAEADNSLALPFDTLSSDERLLPELSLPALSTSSKTTESAKETAATPLPELALPKAEVTAAEPAPVAEKSVTGPAEISMRFSEDSWVEMESHGRKLVVGTQRAGSQRTVHAEPPIQILLGNAPGVEITYRGELVDLQPYQRGKVARVILED